MDRNSIIALFWLCRRRKCRRDRLHWVHPIIKKREEFGAFYTLFVEILDDTNKFFFDVLLTVHLSIFISVINQLDAQNFVLPISLFHASTCFEHHVLIIRRSKLHYTASGIITTVGGRLVHE